PPLREAPKVDPRPWRTASRASRPQGFRDAPGEPALARRPAFARDRDRARGQLPRAAAGQADRGSRRKRDQDSGGADQEDRARVEPDRALRRARHGRRVRDRRLHHRPPQGRRAGRGNANRDQGQRGRSRGVPRRRRVRRRGGGVSDPTGRNLLEVSALNVFYGKSQVVFDLDLVIREGEVVTLLGRNGAGKTSTLLGIAGVNTTESNVINVDGKDLSHLPSFKRVRAGVSMVPSGSRAFPNLTVEENLAMVRGSNGKGWTIKDVYDFFPALAELKGSAGGQLS